MCRPPRRRVPWRVCVVPPPCLWRGEESGAPAASAGPREHTRVPMHTRVCAEHAPPRTRGIAPSSCPHTPSTPPCTPPACCPPRPCTLTRARLWLHAHTHAPQPRARSHPSRVPLPQAHACGCHPQGRGPKPPPARVPHGLVLVPVLVPVLVLSLCRGCGRGTARLGGAGGTEPGRAPSTPLSPCLPLRRCFCMGGCTVPAGGGSGRSLQGLLGGLWGCWGGLGGCGAAGGAVGAAHCKHCMWGRGSRPPVMEGALPLSPAGGVRPPSGSAPGLAALSPKSSLLSPKSSLLAAWGGAGPRSLQQPLSPPPWLPLAQSCGGDPAVLRPPPHPPRTPSCSHCAPGSTKRGN